VGHKRSSAQHTTIKSNCKQNRVAEKPRSTQQNTLDVGRDKSYKILTGQKKKEVAESKGNSSDLETKESLGACPDRIITKLNT